ncbi:molecular chaperone Hsp33 [Malonomonas rubra DSM 5091]|uniref:33 kDa chaperonin n=1 Tax=Malonomonas rubra DSM 5091 TaxID=1122189 RepID=A0A1M6HIC5_MALRU|nr:Hsp33 family molecular chaperone HslO [Malonomonas rubra]SHJ21935.1 molecular chaperone Hsp33 [Malonomonas rubra DSM 5091]
MQDHMVRVVSADGLLRGTAAVTTGLVKEICQRQKSDFTATVALGRLLTGGALLSSLLKGQQRLALMIEGNGPLGKMSVETDAKGRVRGTLSNPVVDLPPKGDRFDVAGAIGRAGFLHVWKDLGLKDPYQSMVQLQTSEVGDDLAWYLASSEQVPSSVSLGVELDSEGAVAAAGGLLIQSLPPGDEDRVEAVIAALQQLPPTTSLLRQGMAPVEILAKVLADVEFRVQETVPLEFYCPCSRQQTESMLRSLGPEELKRLAAEQDSVEVVCEYCRTPYQFSSEEVERLAQH